jgi:hypothetical protein
MSYGLLSELVALIKDPVNIGAVDFDDDLRESVLEAVFVPRKPSGKRTGGVDVDDLDYSVQDICSVLDWAKEHVLGFFLSRLEKTTALYKQEEDRMKGLNASLDGSKSVAGRTS